MHQFVNHLKTGIYFGYEVPVCKDYKLVPFLMFTTSICRINHGAKIDQPIAKIQIVILYLAWNIIIWASQDPIASWYTKFWL